MKNKLILVWRNPNTRMWTGVGLLEYKNNKYYFNYTNGAKIDKFIPFGQMNQLNETYVSDELFPIFKNRLLSKSRPEYEDFLSWLDIKKEENNDLLELARSRGIRATDELQLFPVPEKNEKGMYEVLFFSHGISHIAKHYLERLPKLKKNDRLLILKDIQNESDPLALALRTKNDPVELLGYCPSFFVDDFNRLFELNNTNNVQVVVQKVNLDAPLQLTLLCKLTTKWPDNFQPFDREEFLPYGC
ncbi:hypothetical protein LXN10_06385 [Arcobacter sp. KX21116]|uniref:hypothetical protein n=1 Tax=Arcobacter iocasae TaxID=2906515 RepID=UPI0035D51E57